MIVVFGSINVDILMKVACLPRPGETVHCPSYDLIAGGKGANQACAAARAGGKVAMVGQIGRDVWGEEATRLMAGAGVNLSCVELSDRPTACGTVWIDENAENAIIVASGANLTARSSQVPDEWLSPENSLVLQMEVPPEENWSLIERAYRRGSRILLNLAPANPVPDAMLDMVDVLVVNEVEALMTAKSEGLTISDQPRTLAQLLARRHGATCIVTLGGAGACAVEADGSAWEIMALEVTAVDTTGAGDAFVGILAASLDAGANLPEGLRRASVGAALACLEIGCQSAFPDAAAIVNHIEDIALPIRIDRT